MLPTVLTAMGVIAAVLLLPPRGIRATLRGRRWQARLPALPDTLIELLQAQDDEELTDEFTAWAAQVVMPRMRRSRPTSRGIDATTTRAPGAAVMAHTKPARRAYGIAAREAPGAYTVKRPVSRVRLNGSQPIPQSHEADVSR